jgi:chromosome segregation ATPase
LDEQEGRLAINSTVTNPDGPTFIADDSSDGTRKSMAPATTSSYEAPSSFPDIVRNVTFSPEAKDVADVGNMQTIPLADASPVHPSPPGAKFMENSVDTEYWDIVASRTNYSRGFTLMESSLINTDSETSSPFHTTPPRRIYGETTPRRLLDEWKRDASSDMETEQASPRSRAQMDPLDSSECLWRHRDPTAPFDVFRQNSTNIALEESKAYMDKINKLQAELSDTREQRDDERCHRQLAESKFKQLEHELANQTIDLPVNSSSPPATPPPTASREELWDRNKALVRDIRRAEQNNDALSTQKRGLEEQVRNLDKLWKEELKKNADLTEQLKVAKKTSTLLSLRGKLSKDQGVEEVQIVQQQLNLEKNRADELEAVNAAGILSSFLRAPLEPTQDDEELEDELHDAQEQIYSLKELLEKVQEDYNEALMKSQQLEQRIVELVGSSSHDAKETVDKPQADSLRLAQEQADEIIRLRFELKQATEQKGSATIALEDTHRELDSVTAEREVLNHRFNSLTAGHMETVQSLEAQLNHAVQEGLQLKHDLNSSRQQLSDISFELQSLTADYNENCPRIVQAMSNAIGSFGQNVDALEGSFEQTTNEMSARISNLSAVIKIIRNSFEFEDSAKRCEDNASSLCTTANKYAAIGSNNSSMIESDYITKTTPATPTNFNELSPRFYTPSDRDVSGNMSTSLDHEHSLKKSKNLKRMEEGRGELEGLQHDDDASQAASELTDDGTDDSSLAGISHLFPQPSATNMTISVTNVDDRTQSYPPNRNVIDEVTKLEKELCIVQSELNTMKQSKVDVDLEFKATIVAMMSASDEKLKAIGVTHEDEDSAGETFEELKQRYVKVNNDEIHRATADLLQAYIDERNGLVAELNSVRNEVDDKNKSLRSITAELDSIVAKQSEKDLECERLCLELDNRKLQVSLIENEKDSIISLLTREKEVANQERDALCSERDEMIAERTAISKERDNATDEREFLRSELAAMSQKRTELLAEVESLLTKVESVTAAKKSVTAELESVRNDLDAQRCHVDLMSEAEMQLRAIFELQANELKDVVDDRNGLREMFDSLRLQYDEALSELESRRVEIVEIHAAKQQLTTDVEALLAKEAKTSQDLVLLRSKYDKAKADVLALSQSLADVEVVVRQLQIETSSVRDLLNEKNKWLTEVSTENSSLRSHISLVEKALKERDNLETELADLRSENGGIQLELEKTLESLITAKSAHKKESENSRGLDIKLQNSLESVRILEASCLECNEKLASLEASLVIKEFEIGNLKKEREAAQVLVSIEEGRLLSIQDELQNTKCQVRQVSTRCEELEKEQRHIANCLNVKEAELQCALRDKAAAFADLVANRNVVEMLESQLHGHESTHAAFVFDREGAIEQLERRLEISSAALLKAQNELECVKTLCNSKEQEVARLNEKAKKCEVTCARVRDHGRKSADKCRKWEIYCETQTAHLKTLQFTNAQLKEQTVQIGRMYEEREQTFRQEKALWAHDRQRYKSLSNKYKRELDDLAKELVVRTTTPV